MTIIEVELAEIRKVKADLEKAEAKMRKVFRKMDDGSSLMDEVLDGLNMIDNVISDMDSWIEEYSLEVQVDEAKLVKWEEWATQ